MKAFITVNIDVGRTRLSVNMLLIVLVIIAWLAGNLVEYVLTLAFIIAHEALHMAAAKLAGGNIHAVRFLPVGLNAEVDTACCSKAGRLLIYAAGPSFNFLCAILIQIFMVQVNINTRIAWLALFINLYLGIFNLLPIIPLDGGKIAMELFSGRFGAFKAGKCLRGISVFISIGITVAGLVSFICNRSNISLIVIGIYILMCIRKNKEETAFMNIKSLLFRKSRVLRKGIYPVREIVVLKQVKLSDVIKAMDYIDRFHIINVLDDNMRVIKVMTEQELLEAIMENTPDTTFDNLVHIEYNVHNEVN